MMPMSIRMRNKLVEGTDVTSCGPKCRRSVVIMKC